jgi:chromosome segregation ATPase
MPKQSKKSGKQPSPLAQLASHLGVDKPCQSHVSREEGESSKYPDPTSNKYSLDSHKPSVVEMLNQSQLELNHLITIYGSSQKKRQAAEKEAQDLKLSLESLRTAHADVLDVNKLIAKDCVALSKQVQDLKGVQGELQKTQQQLENARRKLKNSNDNKRSKARRRNASKGKNNISHYNNGHPNLLPYNPQYNMGHPPLLPYPPYILPQPYFLPTTFPYFNYQ